MGLVTSFGEAFSRFHRARTARTGAPSPCALPLAGRGYRRDFHAAAFRAFFAGERAGSASGEFYSQNASSFAAQYGIVNSAKNYFAICELAELGLLTRCRRVVDLGCGPGSFALALARWITESDPQCDVGADLLLVDQSATFEQLFWSAWQQVPQPIRLGRKVSFLNERINGDVSRYVRDRDLVILSHSLLEMLTTDGLATGRLLDGLANSGAIVLVIEYPYPSAERHLREASKAFGKRLRPISCFSWPYVLGGFRRVDLADLGTAWLHRSGIPEGRNLSFVAGLWCPPLLSSRAEHSARHGVVGTYKRAWERHDLSLLRRLFSPNAKYDEKPERPPFRGIREICDYWAENRSKQRGVDFRPRFASTSHNRVDLVWECSFFRRDLDRHLWLSGAMAATLQDGKIQEFTETFVKGLGKSPRHARAQCHSGSALGQNTRTWPPAPTVPASPVAGSCERPLT